MSLTVIDADLDRLAGAVARFHELTQIYARKSLSAAADCGDALQEARALVPCGQWRAWQQANVPFDRSTVNVYMRIAAYRDELQAAGVKTVQGARDYVREHGLLLGSDQGHPDDLVLEIRSLAAEGVSHRDIGRQLGVSRSNVGAIVRGERHGPRSVPAAREVCPTCGRPR